MPVVVNVRRALIEEKVGAGKTPTDGVGCRGVTVMQSLVVTAGRQHEIAV